ncbi:hypothetical protein OKW26_001629 [Paraburkholderia sp. 32]
MKATEPSPPHHSASTIAAATRDSVDAAKTSGGSTLQQRTHARSVALAVSLFLIAFSLRTPITSVGPILLEAVRYTRLSPTGASLFTTLPSLCFGLFGPLAPGFARRLGSERALLVLLVLLTLGIALRIFPVWPDDRYITSHTSSTSRVHDDERSKPPARTDGYGIRPGVHLRHFSVSCFSAHRDVAYRCP